MVASLDGRSRKKNININDGWKFSNGDLPGAESVNYDDSGWINVDLSHDFQIYQPWVAPSEEEKPDLTNQMANIASRLSSRGFKEMGQGWHRKEIVPDDTWRGRRVLLDFEGIMLVGDVYLNGERVGGTDYGYLGFEIDVTEKLRYGSPNVIAVKADTGNPDNSRWYIGDGLFRDVNIQVTDSGQYFTRHSLAIATPVDGDGNRGRCREIFHKDISCQRESLTPRFRLKLRGFSL